MCASGPVSSGLDACARAGISYRTAQRFPGFVCRIADKPASDPCVNAVAPVCLLGVLDRRAGRHVVLRHARRRQPPASARHVRRMVVLARQGRREDPATEVHPTRGDRRHRRRPLNRSDCTSTPQPPIATTATTATHRSDDGTSPHDDRVDGRADHSRSTRPRPRRPTTLDDHEPTEVDHDVTAATTTAHRRAALRRRPPSTWGTMVVMEEARSAFVASAAVVVGLGSGRLVDRAPPAASTPVTGLERLPRELHPVAWWIWALGMATAATRTTNPLLLGSIIAVVAFVVSARRGDAPWSSGFRGYVIAALVVVALRVVLRTLLDGQYGAHVLFHVPELPLPSAAEGIRIGGPVSLEGLLAAFYDGLRLATLILCIGAANVLANPKRLLKSTPASLHEIGVAITVALTVAPQLVESARRVRRARRAARRRAGFASPRAPPSRRARDDRRARPFDPAGRGDGRARARSHDRDERATKDHERRARASGALRCVRRRVRAPRRHHCCGTRRTDARPRGRRRAGRARARSALGAHDAVSPGSVAHRRVGGRGVRLAVAAGLFLAGHVDPDNLNPSLQPLQWPTLQALPLMAILMGALPAWIAPPPRLASSSRSRGRARGSGS